jgi:hypothetical protein
MADIYILLNSVHVIVFIRQHQASGIITALRIRGPVDTARFAMRAIRLLLASRKTSAVPTTAATKKQV